MQMCIYIYLLHLAGAIRHKKTPTQNSELGAAIFSVFFVYLTMKTLTLRANYYRFLNAKESVIYNILYIRLLKFFSAEEPNSIFTFGYKFGGLKFVLTFCTDICSIWRHIYTPFEIDINIHINQLRWASRLKCLDTYILTYIKVYSNKYELFFLLHPRGAIKK